MTTKTSTAVAQLSPAKTGLLTRIAERYHVDADKMASTLKATVFRSKNEMSNEQLMMLLVVADQYKLNPFTAEIFAFESQRGLIPIVSVDGWLRIINERPELAGIQFRYDDNGEWCECIIERKDRTMPVTVREYMAECRRDTGPWRSHPQRMLRHKTLIQCARIAFGFAGIYDQDEGERIIEGEVLAKTVSKPAARDPELSMPDKYESWATDLESLADEGQEGVTKAFAASDAPLREYLTRMEPERWERIKAKAAKVPA